MNEELQLKELNNLREALQKHLRAALLDVLQTYTGLPKDGTDLYNWLKQFRKQNELVFTDDHWEILFTKTDSSKWDTASIISLFDCTDIPQGIKQQVSRAKGLHDELDSSNMTASNLKNGGNYWKRLRIMLNGLKYQNIDSFDTMSLEDTNETVDDEDLEKVHDLNENNKSVEKKIMDNVKAQFCNLKAEVKDDIKCVKDQLDNISKPYQIPTNYSGL